MNEEIFSHSLKAQTRTYYFDCKRTVTNAIYLTITESKQIDEGFEKHKIMIFEEHLDKFIETLLKVKENIQSKQTIKTPEDYIEKQKAKYPNAYKPWSKEEDENLELLYCEGKTITQLSETFARNVGAIIARIKKLELNEKYPK